MRSNVPMVRRTPAPLAPVRRQPLEWIDWVVVVVLAAVAVFIVWGVITLFTTPAGPGRVDGVDLYAGEVHIVWVPASDGNLRTAIYRGVIPGGFTYAGTEPFGLIVGQVGDEVYEEQ